MAELLCFCGRHGEYSIPEHALNSGYELSECPRCKGIREKGLCVDCEKHKATVTFSGDALSHVHGFSERICDCCYLARVQKAFYEVLANLKALRKTMKKSPCRKAL